MTQSNKFEDLNDRFTSLGTGMTQSNKFSDRWRTLLFFFRKRNTNPAYTSVDVHNQLLQNLQRKKSTTSLQLSQRTTANNSFAFTLLLLAP